MKIEWRQIRDEVIGRSATVLTPYGERLLSYADFTASGRGVVSVERYMEHVLELYANTHTEDDTTGGCTSRRLAAAEALILKRLNAGDEHVLISVGAGATAAVTRLQQILGIYLAPATRERIGQGGSVPTAELPVVFVGPYEHHSNEISWREGLCQVVEIDLDTSGRLSTADLEQKLSDPRFSGRRKIGSFSAASNVSGIRTDVAGVARVLHRHGALAFFDYSASAPYVEIDVSGSGDAYLDGVFFSPHKFLGGPGASGILVIRKEIYRRDLPPSVAGGGTVRFVNATVQDYISDIQEREKAGTPAILQTIRAALAIDLQHHLGTDRIEAREQDLMGRALARMGNLPEVEVIGNAPPDSRLAIFSFNVRSGGTYLHPRFVVRLLNDLFGIQSRAGCSCAGPYGHRLLHIDPETSERYRRYIAGGQEGIKPGWVRLNFHYLLTDDEFDFLCDAIEFVARHGVLFLSEYRFDPVSGRWVHVVEREEMVTVSAAEALSYHPDRSDTAFPSVSEEEMADARNRYLSVARERATTLAKTFSPEAINATTDELISFSYISK
jgi:selenocysteine lyase/cysteine desulfurase